MSIAFHRLCAPQLCPNRSSIINSTTGLFAKRFASTSSRRVVEHSHYDLHAWPRAKKPSPHEIFNILGGEGDFANRQEYEKSVKSTYQKFVKVYHPDVCSNHDVVERGHSLLVEQKRQRFDDIQNAYEILRDPSKSSAYRKYQTTSWDDYQRGKTGSFDAYRMANAHRKKYAYENDPKFWHAATWEDYYQMRYGRAAPTREEWEKNKWNILWKVLAVASVVVVLQIMLALERTHEFNRQTRLMNLRANADLADAYDNYGESRSQFQRIRRFLLYRRLALESRDDQELRQEESDMLTNYAKQRVSKLD
ncbi:CIC11C00000003296 [Sungouiella intermedia]|uniref:CIC11C00000003296 n=1 Tax=Sungouiella intermedia TaxID=45354 RepID=A0A1L0BS51_9ASCO|nr:CIC11C00000003296 [[Candida] intermedia]